MVIGVLKTSNRKTLVSRYVTPQKFYYENEAIIFHSLHIIISSFLCVFLLIDTNGLCVKTKGKNFDCSS